ncbi:putative disease resistance protein rdl6 [Quercus suber]|uniref:Disease resistance protein rdl6 n=1 Tax=Quercus suber TaxID=58331 RepID=A0AAW0KLD4_QUESU
MTGIGDLLIQEGKFSSGVSNQIELLKTELNLMQGLLKNVDLRQDEPEPVRQWAAEIRELVYDADDIINNFKASSERGGLIQKILKRCVISNIAKQIFKLRKTLLDYGYGIRDSIIQVGGPSSLDDRKTYSSNERERECRQTFLILNIMLLGLKMVSRRNDIILYVVGFADFVTNANKPNIEKLGKEMVEYCGGLPLAITVLGGALAAKQTQDDLGHIGKIRRLAITLESNDNYLNEYPYLRSLLYFVPSKEFYFKKSKVLRVLNMKNYVGKDLANDIGCFIHLRFLSLENSNINKVPSSLGNLRCLQTLDLWLITYKGRMPNVFKEMEQLRHLYLPYNYRVSEKLELGSPCYLQTLLNVEPETIKMPTSFRFNYLRILVIRYQVDGEGPHLVQILVSSCPRIYELYDMVCSKGGLPLLQYLLLERLYSLDGWRVEEGAMPNLCHLTIFYCWGLKVILDGLRFITTLRELEIRNMPKSFKD